MGGKFVSMYSLRDDFISINIDTTMNDAALHKAQQLDSALMKITQFVIYYYYIATII